MALDFVIVGAEKSATTFVQSCLREHPAICMPEGETPFFEDPDFKSTPLSALRELAAEATPGQVFGIRRPNYLALPQVAERIKMLAPGARLVVILRNPIDRAVSAYFHHVKYGFLPCVPIERGLPELLTSRSTERNSRAGEILEFGFYGRQLRTYLDFFDRDHLLVLLQEDLSANPLGSIQRIYDFLGVDPNYLPRNIRRRVNRGTYSLQSLRVSALGNRFRYTYNDSRSRLFLKEQTYRDRVAFAAVQVAQRVLFFGQIRRRVALSGELFEDLRALYYDDVVELSKLGLVGSALWPDFEQILRTSGHVSRNGSLFEAAARKSA